MRIQKRSFVLFVLFLLALSQQSLLFSQLPSVSLFSDQGDEIEVEMAGTLEEGSLDLIDLIHAPDSYELSKLRLSNPYLLIGSYQSSMTELLWNPNKILNKDRKILPLDLGELDTVSSLTKISQGDLGEKDLSLGLIIPFSHLLVHSFVEVEDPQFSFTNDQVKLANAGIFFSPNGNRSTVVGIDFTRGRLGQSLGVLVSLPLRINESLHRFNWGFSLLDDQVGSADFFSYAWLLYSGDSHEIGLRVGFTSLDDTKGELLITDSLFFLFYGNMELMSLSEKCFLDFRFWSKNDLGFVQELPNLSGIFHIDSDQDAIVNFVLDPWSFEVKYELSISQSDDIWSSEEYLFKNRLNLGAMVDLDLFTLKTDIQFDDVAIGSLYFCASSFEGKVYLEPFTITARMESKLEENYGFSAWYINYCIEIDFTSEAISWQFALENREDILSDQFIRGNHFKLIGFDPWQYIEIEFAMQIDLEV